MALYYAPAVGEGVCSRTNLPPNPTHHRQRTAVRSFRSSQGGHLHTTFPSSPISAGSNSRNPRSHYAYLPVQRVIFEDKGQLVVYEQRSREMEALGLAQLTYADICPSHPCRFFGLGHCSDTCVAKAEK